MSIRGNKGEWSEIYAFFKVIGDKSLYLGDENLEKIKDIVYPIIKILRTESNGNFEYLINGDIVIISEDDQELIRTSVLEFEKRAKSLLKKIQENEETTFDVPEIVEFMEQNYCYSLKAKSSKKTDIIIVIYDQRTKKYDATGGYLIIKEDGDVLCYHIYDRNTFENYLINNTKLDTASSSRHNFGKLYKEKGELFMNLNLQIRFIK